MTFAEMDMEKMVTHRHQCLLRIGVLNIGMVCIIEYAHVIKSDIPAHALGICGGINEEYLKSIQKLEPQSDTGALRVLPRSTQVLRGPLPLLLCCSATNEIFVGLIDTPDQDVTI